MKLSFKFKPSISKKQLEIVEELSYHTTKLYNIINYDLRENGVKTYYDIEKNNKTNVGSIDLGLDNIATLTFKDGLNQYIFCGKKLKSVNSYTNKKIADLQSIEMFKCGSDKFKNTKRINKIRRYRNNYINDYMHKVSKSIIDKSIENNVGKIVIGKLKGIKQNMNYNKNFVQVPIQRLAELISYKAKL